MYQKNSKKGINIFFGMVIFGLQQYSLTILHKYDNILRVVNFVFRAV